MLLLLLQLVPEGAAVEKIAGGYSSLVAVAVDGDGAVWFSDGARIFRHDGRDVAAIRESGALALAFDSEGRLIACEARRIVRIEGDDVAVLAEGLENPGDVAVDETGGVYFTDRTALYRRAPDGRTERIGDDLAWPNGLAIADETLYVADVDQIVTIAGGERRLLVDGAGRPDGMTLDSKGRLYAACDDGIRVWEGGKLVATIAVPERPSDCSLGGNHLYITAETSLYRIRLNAEGR